MGSVRVLWVLLGSYGLYEGLVGYVRVWLVSLRVWLVLGGSGWFCEGLVGSVRL